MDALDADGTTKNPFEGGAYRWEAVTVLNHVVISNGVDLPIIYKAEWDYAQPLYSLREQGVVCCGTIASYQDRLFVGDLTTIISGYENWFEDAEDPYADPFSDDLIITGAVKLQRYQYRMLYSMEQNPKLFDTAESGGLIATLTVDGSGVTRIDSSLKFKIGTLEDGAPLIANSASYLDEEAIVISSSEFGIKTEDEQYAINSSGLTSRLFLKSDGNGYRVTNKEDNDPGFLTYAFEEWESIKAYPVGTTVRFGSLFYKSSVPVNAGEDNPSTNTDQWGLTTGYLNPGTYEVIVSTYLNSLYNMASAREFADDGTRILKMVPLADKLVVYRDSGFFFLSRSNVTLEPFAVEPKYTGGRVADYRHTISNLDGKRHIFLGSSGVYSISRSSAEPEPVGVFEMGPSFWKQIPPEYAEFVYSADNPVTRELFFNVPTGYMSNSAGEYIDQTGAVTQKPLIDWGTIAYDYISKTLSQIDASFTSACYARKPRMKRVGPEQSWFLMGLHSSDSRFFVGTKYRPDNMREGVVVRYGYGPPEVGEVDPYRIYSRLGYGYQSKLRSGLIDFGDSFSDKEFRSYVLELSNKYGTTPIDIVISTTSAVQGTEQVETMSTKNGREIKHVTLNQIRDENMIPLYVRAPYIRDELKVNPAYDINSAYAKPDYFLTGYIGDDITIVANPIKVVGKTYDVSGIDTRQATQTIGQG